MVSGCPSADGHEQLPRKLTPLLSGGGGRGLWAPASRWQSTTPCPSLIRRGIIFMHGGEPKDHEVRPQTDRANACHSPDHPISRSPNTSFTLPVSEPSPSPFAPS